MNQSPQVVTEYGDHAEAVVIGALILVPDRWPEVGRLQPAHFANPRLREVFRVISDIAAAGKRPDALTVSAALGDSPAVQRQLIELAENTPQRTNVAEWARLIIEAHRVRAAQEIGRILAETGDADHAFASLSALCDVSESREYHAPADLATRLDEILHGDVPEAIGTGIERFDTLFGGLRRKELMIIGARPGHGKTAMALNIAQRAERGVYFFSGEMDRDAILMRYASSLSGVPLTRIIRGHCNDADNRKLESARDHIRQGKFHVNDRSMPTAEDIVREVMRVKFQHDIDIVIVDYLQRMGTALPGSVQLHEQIMHNCRLLKSMAKDLDVAVILPAQVNQSVDSREDKQPGLGDLLYSGAISAEADIVATLMLPGKYDHNDNRNATMSVVKYRQGQTGDIPLVYESEYVRFVSPLREAAA